MVLWQIENKLDTQKRKNELPTYYAKKGTAQSWIILKKLTRQETNFRGKTVLIRNLERFFSFKKPY